MPKAAPTTTPADPAEPLPPPPPPGPPGSMAVERVPIASLVPDPINPRDHDSKNLAAIRESLMSFGQVEPLVVQRSSGMVIGGNGRLSQMRSLGWTTADVVRVDLDDAAARRLSIALNRSAELGRWNERNLRAELTKLSIASPDLKIPGFSADELRQKMTDHRGAVTRLVTGPDDEPVPLRREAISKRGERYELGPHVLVCGDATSADDLDKACGGAPVDMVWTDPPYGVAYAQKTGRKIENDDIDEQALEQLLRASFTLAKGRCRPGAVWYVAGPHAATGRLFGNVLHELGLWRQLLIWEKDSLVLSRCDYHYRHEPIWYGWVTGAAHREPPDRSQDSIWSFPRPKRSDDHPTQKPVPLIARALLNSSAPDERVLDMFGGSGSTLIACAETGRRAVLTEIDPVYADAIRRRWGRWALKHGINPGPGAILEDA